MFCPECGNHAANKALRMLGIEDNTQSIKWAYTENTEGLVVVGGAIIKVSSLTPSIKELEGGTVSISGAVNEKVTLTAYGNSPTLMDIGGAIMATDSTIIVYSDNFAIEGVALPEKGIYIPNMEGQTIELSYGTIHPIDQKYLPGGSIRMDAYGNSEMTVNDALLNLALEGGGTTTFASGMEPFWADVLAKQPDYLIFNVGDNLRMPICVLYATEGSVRSGESCISANGLLSLYGTNLLGYFVMAQTKDGKGVKISVKSELVIFPETALAEHGGE